MCWFLVFCNDDRPWPGISQSQVQHHLCVVPVVSTGVFFFFCPLYFLLFVSWCGRTTDIDVLAS